MPTSPPPQTSAEARAYSVAALEADLVGPMTRDPFGVETLQLPPSRWYLSGFLAPAGGRTIDKDDRLDPEAQDELGRGNDKDEQEADPDEPQSKRKSFFPASMGVSVLLPPASTASTPAEAETITVTLTYADYEPIEPDPTSAPEPTDGKRTPRDRPNWRRIPRSPAPITIALDPASLATPTAVPDSKGLELEARLAPTSGPGLPPGARALSLFVVNRREPASKLQADLAFVFQVQLQLHYAPGFLPRPNLTGDGATHFDDAIADLQYRNHMEYAVGHGVSVSWDTPSEHDRRARDVRTQWLPKTEVARVITHEIDGVVTSMERLSLLKSANDVHEALQELPRAYATWIADQRAIDISDGTDVTDHENRAKTRDILLAEAEKARARIARAIRWATLAPRMLAYPPTLAADPTDGVRDAPWFEHRGESGGVLLRPLRSDERDRLDIPGRLEAARQRLDAQATERGEVQAQLRGARGDRRKTRELNLRKGELLEPQRRMEAEVRRLEDMERKLAGASAEVAFLARCPVCGEEASAWEPRENDCFAARCGVSSCEARWGVRWEPSSGTRIPILGLGGSIDGEGVRPSDSPPQWVDDVLGCDVLAIPHLRAGVVEYLAPRSMGVDDGVEARSK